MGVGVTILGTATGVGKTFVAALLHRLLPGCAPAGMLDSLPAALAENVLADLLPVFDFIPREMPGAAADLGRDEAEYSVPDGPILLVADGERDDFHAAVYGVLALLPKETRSRVAGIIVNRAPDETPRFRSGLSRLEEITGIPVLGVVPKIVVAENNGGGTGCPPPRPPLDAALPVAPGTAGYRDAALLARHPAFGIRFAADAETLGTPDILILPECRDAGAWFDGPAVALAESGTPVVDLGYASPAPEPEAAPLPVSGRVHTLTGIYSCLSGIEFSGFAAPPFPASDTTPFAAIDFGKGRVHEGMVRGATLSTRIRGFFGNEPVRERLAGELLRRKGEEEDDGVIGSVGDWERLRKALIQASPAEHT